MEVTLGFLGSHFNAPFGQIEIRNGSQSKSTKVLCMCSLALPQLQQNATTSLANTGGNCFTKSLWTNKPLNSGTMVAQLSSQKYLNWMTATEAKTKILDSHWKRGSPKTCFLKTDIGVVIDQVGSLKLPRPLKQNNENKKSNFFKRLRWIQQEHWGSRQWTWWAAGSFYVRILTFSRSYLSFAISASCAINFFKLLLKIISLETCSYSPICPFGAQRLPLRHPVIRVQMKINFIN